MSDDEDMLILTIAFTATGRCLGYVQTDEEGTYLVPCATPAVSSQLEHILATEYPDVRKALS